MKVAKIRWLAGLVAVLLLGSAAGAFGAMVEPTLISDANYKPCDPEYKFDSIGDDEPWIPLANGEPAIYTWDNVPSCDGTTSGSVTVKLWIYTDELGQELVKFEVVDGKAGKVYVKGGSGGNLYDYSPDGVKADEGLHAPVNPSGYYADVSHVSFCLCYEPEEEEVCYKDETAWAAGSRYVEKGNWATYVTYGGVEKTVNVYAGQTMLAGTATFSAPVDGWVDITIELANGFVFWGDDLDEDGIADSDNVKVQDYEFAPSGNPSPGLFEWKETAPLKSTSWTITVPENNFYGVHLDVAYPVACEL